MKRIGEDGAEKLDYTPGAFSVERHIHGKSVCTTCHAITQAPVTAQIIDKGIPTSGLLARVLVAKFLDHLPLYRQEGVFERSGLAIPRHSMFGACGGQLHPSSMPFGACCSIAKSCTPTRRRWPCSRRARARPIGRMSGPTLAPNTTSLKAVIYEFAESRSGSHARPFLEGWQGTLVCDEFSGQKALFAKGVTEAGCLAHARRKFQELWVSHKTAPAGEALDLIRPIYDVERLRGELDARQRYRLRQLRSKPVTETLRQWLVLHRQRASDGTAIAKTITTV
jgi:hypothetical protein